jgi:hypothetical protein
MALLSNGGFDLDVLTVALFAVTSLLEIQQVMRKVPKPSRQLNALLYTKRTMNPSTPQCSKKTIVNPYTKTSNEVRQT